jgi:hypothetical protein
VTTAVRQFALACRRVRALGALVLITLGATSRAGAQADVPLGVRRETGAPSRPLRAVGDVALCRALDCERTLSAALELAPSARWWITAEGAAGRSVVQPASAPSADARVDLFYGSAERQLWIGRGAGTARGFDSSGAIGNRWIEYGAALRWRSISVAVDVGAGSQPMRTERTTTQTQRIVETLDSLTGATRVDTVTQLGSESARFDRTRWSSTALRLGWRSDAWKLGAVIGRARSRAGRPVVWSTTEAERRVGRSIGIVASLGTYPGSFATLAAESPRARWMLGVGVTAATGRRSPDVPHPPTAPATSERFAAIRLAPGRYRIVVHLPDAMKVELASDFTGWKPFDMQRDAGDRWSAELLAPPGVHRISLRVDGGPWIAPPGLTAEDDGFGGSAAVFTVP